MLSVRMNDSAVALLGERPLPALAPGLREMAVRGIERRDAVLTWAGSPFAAVRSAPSSDLTGWECDETSFHLERFVPVDKTTDEGVPHIPEEGQRILLSQGLALALALREQVYALTPVVPVRCIVAANETNGTFRFHQIRPGEGWNVPDLDLYQSDKVLVVDIEPPGTAARP
ncbi:hypothetical protein FHX82_000534 [Amycolatopsis bartoniae]|uniref:hypothetical protein n=1 Tax=Amycolatopsis bartoniae TaxID=941986 RepID=UPI001190DDDD|nr:hypothetical protein [Amycolatopsis bartoniae]MBB2933514.1 hypothetical protein [Amycolatopsis bartoniae]TVT07613.1 hypothetical protein FNH07_15735 [Amycolatopsis bartoniae]